MMFKNRFVCKWLSVILDAEHFFRIHFQAFCNCHSCRDKDTFSIECTSEGTWCKACKLSKLVFGEFSFDKLQLQIND